MDKKESWKDIVGYEGFYQVSDQGRVRSVDRVVISSDNKRYNYKGQLLKPSVEDGYGRVNLTKNSSQKKCKINRLVLEAFCGDSPLHALHKNGDRSDNRLKNLYWGTQSENVHDSVRHGTHREVQKTHCPRNHPLEEPNLIKNQMKIGKRSCRACEQAKSHINRHGGDMQDVSDIKFCKIMEKSNAKIREGSEVVNQA